jgi:hypothetical protein
MTENGLQGCNAMQKKPTLQGLTARLAKNGLQGW